jgi:hypothetical protein
MQRWAGSLAVRLSFGYAGFISPARWGEAPPGPGLPSRFDQNTRTPKWTAASACGKLWCGRRRAARPVRVWRMRAPVRSVGPHPSRPLIKQHEPSLSTFPRTFWWKARGHADQIRSDLRAGAADPDRSGKPWGRVRLLQWPLFQRQARLREPFLRAAERGCRGASHHL